MSVEWMNYKDYSKMSNKNDEETVEDVVEEEEAIKSTSEEKDEEDTLGYVDNSDKVYLRKEPRKSAEYKCILDRNSELLIYGTKTDINGNDWYQVETAYGIDGYILSDYVTLNK